MTDPSDQPQPNAPQPPKRPSSTPPTTKPTASPAAEHANKDNLKEQPAEPETSSVTQKSPGQHHSETSKASSTEPSASNPPTAGRANAPTSASASPQSTPAAPSAHRRSFWLAAIALLFSVTSLVAGGWWLNYQQQRADQIDRQLGALQASQQQLNQRQQQQNQVIQQGLELDRELRNEQTKLLKQLQQNTRKLLALPGTGREDWLMAEAEYLLRLANQRLLLEKDSQGSIALLQAADQVLLETQDVRLLPVRQQIIREIQQLKLAAGADRVGLFMQIQALHEQLQSLTWQPQEFSAPSNTASAEQTNNAGDKTEITEEASWSNKLAVWLKPLDQYIRFNAYDHQSPPKALTADQQLYLKQNLRLTLERAQLAVLQKQTELYRSSLQTAKDSLNNYFISQPQQQSLLADLDYLLAQNIDPKLPDISESLQLLKEKIATNYRTPALTERSSATAAEPVAKGATVDVTEEAR